MIYEYLNDHKCLVESLRNAQKDPCFFNPKGPASAWIRMAHPPRVSAWRWHELDSVPTSGAWTPGTLAASKTRQVRQVHSSGSQVWAMSNGYIWYRNTISGWWFQTWFLFSIIYGIILPIDEIIFFKMVKPPTRYDLITHRSITNMGWCHEWCQIYNEILIAMVCMFNFV